MTFQKIEGNSTCCIDSLLQKCDNIPDLVIIEVTKPNEENQFYCLRYMAVDLSEVVQGNNGVIRESFAGIQPIKKMLCKSLREDLAFLQTYNLCGKYNVEIKIKANGILDQEEMNICLGKTGLKYKNFG
ncbi:MAG: hypothetical protein ACMXYG_06510 [Candidatus Woesearchaeota archaeon]